MNPFTTIPKFISIYRGISCYLKKVPEFDKLREEGRYDEEREMIRSNIKIFCDKMQKVLKINFEITGEEHIPEDETYMVYANHQSFADIYAILYLFSNYRQMGFISKDEWRKVKILARGIEYTRSVFLIRGNGREALQAIKESSALLEKGFALTIFPEGTRSQSSEMGEFKPGALKFAQKGKVPILPVTIDGGYRLYEEKHTYQPCTIRITVHPLVHIEEMDKHQAVEAYQQIETTIRESLS